MAGNREGGLKAAQANKDKYGEDYYSRIGKIGGSEKVPKGFKVVPGLAQRAGKKGGLVSRRGRKLTLEEKERVLRNNGYDTQDSNPTNTRHSSWVSRRLRGV